MPAQTVASPAAQPVPATRTAPAKSREPGAGGDRFGRQLDAARHHHHQPSNAKKDTQEAKAAKSQQKAEPSAAGSSSEASGAAPPVAPGAAGTSEADAQRDASGQDRGKADDAPTDGVPQLVPTSLFPFVGAALPGSMAHRGAFASSAGVMLGAHGAAAVSAGIANAAKLLLASDADAAAAGKQAVIVSGTVGLEDILDAAHGRAADDVQGAATPVASIGTAQLPALPAQPTGAHLLTMAAPVGTQAFHQELAGQVTWLASQDIKQARIRVHPEDLGPVDLTVSMSHDRVDVVFSVQHPGALQQNLPQLGQMLAQHGLSLGHAEVGQHGGQGPSAQHRGADGIAVDEAAELQITSAGVVAGASSLLDAFA